MEALCIRLFGPLEVSRGVSRFPPFPTRKSRSLFSFLLLNRARPHLRDVLIGRFWGECPEAAARKQLRTTLWRIRKVLSADPARDGVRLVSEDRSVALELEPRGWLDTLDFEAKLSRVPRRPPEKLSEAEADLLREAVDLYRGDLLEEVYDDWCVYERERLRILALDALHRLMGYHLHLGEWGNAIERGQRLLAADPFLEEVHRGLMQCYLAMQNRAAALRQYRVCERLLREELDAAPMPETAALYERIRRGDAPPYRPQAEPEGPVMSDVTSRAEALRRLRAADRHLVHSRRNLRRGIEAVRRTPPE